MADLEGRKCLFNDALNTFYLRLCCVGHMVKDHFDTQRGCRHMGYSFRLASRVLLYTPYHKQDSTYHDFVIPVVEHWLDNGQQMYGERYLPSYTIFISIRMLVKTRSIELTLPRFYQYIQYVYSHGYSFYISIKLKITSICTRFFVLKMSNFGSVLA